jgi:hypothetical protein
MKDIFIVDHITKISQTHVSPKMMEDFNIKIKNVYVFHFAKIPLYYIELKDKSDYIEFANKMQKLINGLNYQVLLKTSEKESIFITTFNLFELP